MPFSEEMLSQEWFRRRLSQFLVICGLIPPSQHVDLYYCMYYRNWLKKINTVPQLQVYSAFQKFVVDSLPMSEPSTDIGFLYDAVRYIGLFDRERCACCLTSARIVEVLFISLELFIYAWRRSIYFMWSFVFVYVSIGFVGERDCIRRNASCYLISATRLFTMIRCSRTLIPSSKS